MKKLSIITFATIAIMMVVSMAFVLAPNTDSVDADITTGDVHYGVPIVATDGEKVDVDLNAVLYNGSWSLDNSGVSVPVSGLRVDNNRYLRGNVVHNTYNMQQGSVGVKSGSFTEQIHFYFEYTIYFNGNGGSAPSLPTYLNAGMKSVSVATHSTKIFDGWYTAATGGTYLGTTSIDLSKLTSYSTTVYAHWTNPTVSLTVGNTQVTSGGILDYTPTVSPAAAKITIVSDTTGCNLTAVLQGGRYHIQGTLTDLLPGTYAVSMYASYDGYNNSPTRTMNLTVPVFVYEPLTATVVKGTDFTYEITANPSSSRIQSYTVREGTTTITSGFTASTAIRAFGINFNEVGVYNVILTIGASGYTSTTKTLILSVIEPPVIVNPPSVVSIEYQYHNSLSGGVYFTAYQAANYETLVWDFGDGTSNTSGLSVLHQFKTSGDKTVTLRLNNSQSTPSYVEKTVTVPVVVSFISKADAWVGIEYSHSIPVSDNLTYTLETDIVQSWLTLSDFTKDGQRYLLLSGTPLSGLANTTLEVTINGPALPLETYTIYIWPAVDDSSITTGFTYVVSGHTVTLTNTGSQQVGITMFVDWGDGNGYTRQVSNTTASHTYTNDDVYRVSMALVVNNEQYDTFQFITVPNLPQYTLTYHGNDGTGAMAQKVGSYIEVEQCGFTYNDRTFIRWTTQSNGGGTFYLPGDMILLTGNITLYATWTGIDYEEDPTPPTPEGDKPFWKETWFLFFLLILILLIIIAVAKRILQGNKKKKK